MLFIQAELLNKYCEMLDFKFLVTHFEILFKLQNYITLYYITRHYITLHPYTFHRFSVCHKTVEYETSHKYT